MAQDVVLAIDNGTQSIRALLFDLQGNLLAKSRVPIEPYFSEHPGWAEQHPEYFWNMLCQACQQLWTTNRHPQSRDRRSGADHAARHGDQSWIVTVKPLRPAIIWLDQRRTEGLETGRRAVGAGL